MAKYAEFQQEIKNSDSATPQNTVSGMQNLQPEVEVQEPPKVDCSDGQATHLREGLYWITNKKSRTRLD
ncbi:hypothetical protein FRC00_004994, partial [Tulasnella sp. 408]